MNDDEVKAWLSDDERRMWAQNGKPYMATLMRTLAETRKALVEHEWSEVYGGQRSCAICACLPGSHSTSCIFATMPRPK